MPHQCVRCNTLYEDGSEELLKGCTCGSKFFFFVSQKNLEKAKNLVNNLTDDEKKQIEQDVLEMAGSEIDDEKPVILDLESINILAPGKYEIDLVDIFKGRPLVYKLEEGKYIIDIASTFSAKDLDKKRELK